MKPLVALSRIALAAGMAAVLAACGSTASESSSVPEPANESALGATAGDADGYADGFPLPDCAGQDPNSCTFAGFDPTLDGFSFANWGGTGTIGATEMIALFGEKKVCAEISGDECVLYPAAKQWATQINEAMSGGHCEGMAVTSALIQLGYYDPSDFESTAETTFDLDHENPAVASTIDYWFATQYLEPVQRAYQEYQQKQPSQIAADLAVGLNNGTGYTLGLWSSDGGGHAVTPIAVTNEGGSIVIHVYDNNYPATVQRVIIDPQTEQYSYAAGSTNPQAETGGFEGGLGMIELTPMESRLQESFPAPFEDSKNGSRNSHVLVTSPDPNALFGVLLTIGDKVYDTRDKTVKLPAGVSLRSSLGDHPASGTTGPLPMYSPPPPSYAPSYSSTMPYWSPMGYYNMMAPGAYGPQSVMSGGWTSMTVNQNVTGPYKVEVAPVPAPTPAPAPAPSPSNSPSPSPSSSPSSLPPVTLSVDSSDSARVTLRAGELNGSVSAGVDAKGAVDMQIADLKGALVNVANGVNSANLPIQPGVNVSVGSRDAEGVAAIELIDGANDQVLGAYGLAEESDSGAVTDLDVVFNEETGEFEVTEYEAEAEEFEPEVVSLLRELNGDDGGSDSGDDSGDDGGSDSGDDGGDDSGEGE